MLVLSTQCILQDIVATCLSFHTDSPLPSAGSRVREYALENGSEYPRANILEVLRQKHMRKTTPQEVWYPKVVVIARGDVFHFFFLEALLA